MSTKKTSAKAAKKPVAKKPAAKKPAKPAAKKPAAKKAAPKKEAVKKAAVKKGEPKKVAPKVEAAKKPVADKEPAPAKKSSAKVPPKIVSRASVKSVPVISPEQLDKMDAEQAEQRKIAMDIALRMKKRMQAAESKKVAETEPAIKLSRRPTTRAAGKSTEKFPEADLRRFRKNLLDLRESLQGKSGALKVAALERDDERTQEDDDGTDAFMRLQALGQVGDQNRTIAQIDEALHKIEDGTYGVCEMCGQLIRKQRLEHLPFARTCMECQSEVEKPFGTR